GPEPSWASSAGVLASRALYQSGRAPVMELLRTRPDRTPVRPPQGARGPRATMRRTHDLDDAPCTRLPIDAGARSRSGDLRRFSKHAATLTPDPDTTRSLGGCPGRRPGSGVAAGCSAGRDPGRVGRKSRWQAGGCWLRI